MREAATNIIPKIVGSTIKRVSDVLFPNLSQIISHSQELESQEQELIIKYLLIKYNYFGVNKFE